MSITIEACAGGWVLTDRNGYKTVFPTWDGLVQRLRILLSDNGEPFK